MIAYYPVLYDDELLYSYIARIYAHSGYCSYRQFSEGFYKTTRKEPNIEFADVYDEEFISVLGIQSYRTLLSKYTVFNAYAHFVPKEKKERAIKMIEVGNISFKNLLPFESRGDERTLKYCPMCISLDRERFGEAYWHRAHQINSINVCTRHKVRLNKSSVSLMGKRSPNLYPLEHEIINDKSEYCDISDKELQISNYIVSVFETELITEDIISISSFLHSILDLKGYVKGKFGFVEMKRLISDLEEFYEDTSFGKYIVKSRFEKIIEGKRYNFTEICLLGFFLNITAKLLVKRDDKIEVKEYKKRAKRKNNKGGVVKKDWDTIDDNMIDKVKVAIEETLLSEVPQRVTITGIAKKIEYNSTSIRNLKRCVELINENIETQEHFWARKLIWAYEDTLKSGEMMCWRRLRDRTNMRPENVYASLEYLKQIAGDKIYNDIKSLI